MKGKESVTDNTANTREIIVGKRKVLLKAWQDGCHYHAAPFDPITGQQLTDSISATIETGQDFEKSYMGGGIRIVDHLLQTLESILVPA